jgi:hypothetical protein
MVNVAAAEFEAALLVSPPMNGPEIVAAAIATGKEDPHQCHETTSGCPRSRL